MKVRIRHGDACLCAELIHLWLRSDNLGDESEPLTFRRMAAEMFAAIPEANAAALFSAAGPTLLMLARIGQHWFDVAGKPADIRRSKEP